MCKVVHQIVNYIKIINLKYRNSLDLYYADVKNQRLVIEIKILLCDFFFFLLVFYREYIF